jgi:uncharacterized protein (TIGR03000 family)
MFRNTFSFAGALLLSGAAIVVMPSPGRAQHGGHGGGHGGGGHFSGGHVGGAHFGGGFNHGAFNHGAFNHSFSGYRPYYHNYGYRYRSYGYPYLYGYGAYPYSDGYYPYYSNYSAYPYYDSYDDSYPGYGYGSYPSYNGPLYSAPPSSVGPAASSPVPADMTAHVTVRAPADAELWFDGTKTTSTGPVRDFQTPGLAAGHKYTYTIRARWLENGNEVTQTQQVGVTAGADIRVDFPRAAATAKPAPSQER